MKKNSAARAVVVLVTGIVLLAVALIAGNDLASNLSGLCIGLGAGFGGMGTAELIMVRYYGKHPIRRRHEEIEAGDERNISIHNLAKARAFDVTVRFMMLIPFVLIFMDLPPWTTFAVIAFYMFAISLRYYYIIKYSKVM